MQIINEGMIVNKFIGKMIGCGNCNGYFRLTEEDTKSIREKGVPTQTYIDWVGTCKRQVMYCIMCPTKNCHKDIDFFV